MFTGNRLCSLSFISIVVLNEYFPLVEKEKKKTSVEGGRRNRLSVGRLSRFIGQTVNEVSNKTMNPNSTMLLSFF